MAQHTTVREVGGPWSLATSRTFWEAAAQTARFLSLDVDGRGWPAVGDRDPVISAAQQQLPGPRPCGFHAPFEAAAWAVLSQRIRITQAARLRDDLIRRHGHDGALPTPGRLRTLDLDLPGRKPEYLRAVADAAFDGVLDGRRLRDLDPEAAAAQAWRPYRSWAAVHLRILREQRTHEISGTAATTMNHR